MGRAMRLQHEIEGRFEHDPGLSLRHIVVVTDAHGGVTLMGDVGTDTERTRAARLARAAGAARVNNQLRTAKQRAATTTPPSGQAASGAVPRSLGRGDSSDPDQVIMDAIESGLRREPSTAKADIKVDAVNGSVILRGTVPSETARSRAVDIARATPGVTKIIEDLLVPMPP